MAASIRRLPVVLVVVLVVATAASARLGPSRTRATAAAPYVLLGPPTHSTVPLAALAALKERSLQLDLVSAPAVLQEPIPMSTGPPTNRPASSVLPDPILR